MKSTLATTTPILLALAVLTGTVSGDLTSVDWREPGDGLLTRDSRTGLLWLDWSYTTGSGYDNIAPALLPGRYYEGFRYATEQEIRTLYAHAGAVLIDPIDNRDPGNLPANHLLRELLGATMTNGAEAIYDLPGGEDENPSTVGNYYGDGPFHMGTAFNTTNGQIAVRWINFADNVQTSWMGHALVTIPAPGAIAWAGLLWITRGRRRPS